MLGSKVNHTLSELSGETPDFPYLSSSAYVWLDVHKIKNQMHHGKEHDEELCNANPSTMARGLLPLYT